MAVHEPIHSFVDVYMYNARRLRQLLSVHVVRGLRQYVCFKLYRKSKSKSFSKPSEIMVTVPVIVY